MKANKQAEALVMALEEIGKGTAEAGGDQHVLARLAHAALAAYRKEKQL